MNPEQKSQKQLIIQSFEKMDITMLEVLLDDARTYQNTTKEIFIERLDLIFQELKINGNTQLTPYKGYCNHSYCPNKGCKGYSFVADKSRMHLDLIFEENETDYVDISHCNGFHIIHPPKDIRQLINIEFFEEEKEDSPSEDFSVLLHNSKNAVLELLAYTNADAIIDRRIYEKWCIKYNELYFTSRAYYDDLLEYSHSARSDFERFNSLYQTMGSLIDFLQLDNAAISATSKNPVIDHEDDFPLLQWLVKYEDLRDIISQMTQLLSLRVEKSAHFYRVKSIGLKISIHDFEGINRFKQLFDKPYEKMLDKYTTFNDDNFARAYQNFDENIADNLYSLSYHLKMRRII